MAKGRSPEEQAALDARLCTGPQHGAGICTNTVGPNSRPNQIRCQSCMNKRIGKKPPPRNADPLMFLTKALRMLVTGPGAAEIGADIVLNQGGRLFIFKCACGSIYCGPNRYRCSVCAKRVDEPDFAGRRLGDGHKV